MAEKIYTIPIHEAFSLKKGCPLCTIRMRLMQEEGTRILGAAMMEPEIRRQTNRLGFCKAHLQQMADAGQQLPLALMLSTHLETLGEALFIKTKPPLSKEPGEKKLADAYQKARSSCYLCDRVSEFMTRVYENLCYYYTTEEPFRALFSQQEFFCETHSARLLDEAKKQLPKRLAAPFSTQLAACNQRYLHQLREDLDWFCKKFDYRYEKEDWKNAKDAVERTVRYLS